MIHISENLGAGLTRNIEMHDANSLIGSCKAAIGIIIMDIWPG